MGHLMHFMAFTAYFIQECVEVVKSVFIIDNVVILRGSILFGLEVV